MDLLGELNLKDEKSGDIQYHSFKPVSKLKYFKKSNRKILKDTQSEENKDEIENEK